MVREETVFKLTPSDIALKQKAIEGTIDWLENNIPSCGICEQCDCGYKYTPHERELCRKRQYQASLEKIEWDKKITKWKNELKKIKKIRGTINEI